MEQPRSVNMGEADFLDTIPDHLKCPICFQIPKTKVFQCREGHPICLECYAKVNQCCPQCRFRFERSPIRNLVMEGMLEELSADCHFKEAGCVQKLSWRSLQDHLKVCTFQDKLPKDPPACHSQLEWKHCRQTEQNGVEAYYYETASQTNPGSFRLLIPQFSTRPALTRYCILLDNHLQRIVYLIVIFVREEDGGKKGITWTAFFWHHSSVGRIVAGEEEPLDLQPKIPSQLMCSLKGSEHSMTWSVHPKNIYKPIDISSPAFAMNMPAYLFVEGERDELTLVITFVPPTET